MQPLGIFILAVGIWITYSGLYGIRPWDVAQAIIKDPSNSRNIIAKAKAVANEPYNDLFQSAKNLSRHVGGGTKGVNPFALFPVSDDWKKHLARGSAGGTDYMMPVGTPVVTPKGGVVSNVENNGSAGDTTTVRMDDGYSIVFQHLSKFLAKTGETVKAMQPVALSGGAKGAKGAGSSTGAHLHVHVLTPSGARMEYSKYMAGKANA